MPPPIDNPQSKNFRGRRVPGDNQFPSEFKLIGVKISEDEDDVVFDLFFTKEVNPASISLESFLINGKELDEVKMQFTKTSRGVHLTVPKNQFPVKDNKSFSINIQKIVSFDNQPVPPEELQDANINCFFKFLRKEKQWVKY